MIAFKSQIVFSLGALLLLAGCGNAGVRTVTVERTRTVTRTAPRQPLVYTETGEGALAYQPDHMTWYDSQGAWINRVRWASWGGQFAVGHGDFNSETCKPDCAAGKVITTPIKITLSNRALCEGVTAYLDWTIEGLRKPVLSGSEYEPGGAILAATFQTKQNSGCFG